MRRLTLDFETASEVDLKMVGSWPYWQHPTTEILCLCWRMDGEWYEWIPRLEPFLNAAVAFLHVAAQSQDVIFEAHNAAFEQAGWACMMVPKYGMPPIPPERWDCTMARSYYRGLPGALDMGAKVLGLGEEKDQEGKKLTLGLSKPITIPKWMTWRPAEVSVKDWKALYVKGTKDRTPATLRRVAQYCTQDVRTEIELGDAVGPLSPYERRVWELDQKMNQRGLRVDQAYVAKCIKIVEDASAPLVREFHRLTGGVEPTQVVVLTQWCQREGLEITNLNKETLKSLGIVGLAEDQEDVDDQPSTSDMSVTIPLHVRKVLEIRSVLASASIKKLYRMRACLSDDGRVRYTMQYHGAGPGRWAGRLFQPHNFPRGKIEWDDGSAGHKPDQLITAINTGDAQFVGDCFGDPIAAVASGLRHALVASPGNDFNTGDFAGIEARVVLALAGQHDKTELMASGQDVYFDFAEDIHRQPKGTWNCPSKEQLKTNQKLFLVQRQDGKGGVLGCGFQCGAENFNNKFLGGKDFDLAKKIVNHYRYGWAPRVPKLWEALEEAALRAVWDKAAYETYGITYRYEGRWLACYLPDGQIMYYFNPQPCRRPMPWDDTDIRDGWTYQAMKLGQFKTIQAYGGLLTENVVQKIARGFLCEAMHRLEANNLPLVLTVHDEAMSEVPEARSDAKLYEQIMGEPTALSRSIRCPITVEGWAGPCYKK